jgi:hypothetical protein
MQAKIAEDPIMANTTDSQQRPHPTPRSRNNYSGTLAAQIREIIRLNPYFSTKRICAELHLDHRKYSQYVRNQKSLLKHNKCNKLQHDSHRNLIVWNLPQLDKLKEKIQANPRSHGWNYNSGNRLLFFHDDHLGSILWHNTNRIELYLKGKPLVAKAKTLFCRAFFLNQIIPNIREIDRIFDLGRVERKHHTFIIGKKVPRFQIDYFANSHGLTILSDNSHKESLEVVETQPFWLDTLQKIGIDFRESMDKHMQLLDAMNKIQRQIDKRVGRSLLQRIKHLLR